jgi:hypothetical protein
LSSGEPVSEVAVKLLDLVHAAVGLDEADFRKNFPDAALVFEPGVLDDAEPPASDATETGEFKTTTKLPLDPRGVVGPRELDPGSVVVFLRKRSTWTPFEDVLTVGRATVQDVCVPLSSVSKFHVCLTRSPEGWKVTDQRATNRTFVDDEPLQPGGSARLRDGTRVGFGPEARATFFTPEGMFRILGRLRSDR